MIRNESILVGGQRRDFPTCESLEQASRLKCAFPRRYWTQWTLESSTIIILAGPLGPEAKFYNTSLTWATLACDIHWAGRNAYRTCALDGQVADLDANKERAIVYDVNTSAGNYEHNRTIPLRPRISDNLSSLQYR